MESKLVNSNHWFLFFDSYYYAWKIQKNWLIPEILETLVYFIVLLPYYATLFHRRYKYYLLKSLVISITSLIVVNVIILAQCKQPYSTP